ncbi:hypothetical protein OK006_3011 [Actinobacteria bacterium OK006]|nr:hypothetical protein OK006_3011 [Actinobacteria bacterium OK006]
MRPPVSRTRSTRTAWPATASPIGSSPATPRHCVPSRPPVRPIGQHQARSPPCSSSASAKLRPERTWPSCTTSPRRSTLSRDCFRRPSHCATRTRSGRPCYVGSGPEDGSTSRAMVNRTPRNPTGCSICGTTLRATLCASGTSPVSGSTRRSSRSSRPARPIWPHGRTPTSPSALPGHSSSPTSGIIAAQWQLNSLRSRHVATSFHEKLLESSGGRGRAALVPTARDAAHALYAAVRERRSERPEAVQVWAAYVHLDP